MQGVRGISRWKVMKLGALSWWRSFVTGLREWKYAMELWRGHLKQVEGQFGSGVVSYFSFLRWLLFLNLLIFALEFGFVVLPTVVICTSWNQESHMNNITGCSYQKPVSTNQSLQLGDVPNAVLQFFTGQGWIGTTLMFYSNYPSKRLISEEGVTYNLPLAYLLTGGCTLILCFFLMITNLMGNLKDSYIESEGMFNSYANKVFAVWDYCISEEIAARHKHRIIVQDINSDIAEEQRKRRVQNRTRKQKCALYSSRIAVNFIVVPALWYVSFVVIIQAIFNPEDLDFTDKGQSNMERILASYGSSLLIALAITIPNLLLPLLFEFLSIFEDWSAEVELALNLWRRVFVKLPSVAALMILLYINIDKKTKKKSRNQHYRLEACEQCWEDELAAQMYMLVWMDFFVVILTTLGLETLRKVFYNKFSCFRRIGMQQFDIPRNVLDLVYGQCLILLGGFFSPLLPALGVIKLFLLFYVKKVSLMYNNTLPDRPYQGAKSTYIFTLLLLFTFFMTCGLVGWGVTRVPPSLCGPFRNANCDLSTSILSILSAEVSKWPEWLHQAVFYMSTAAFILPITLLVLVCLHYFRSVAKAHRCVIGMLKDHLAFETKIKQQLLKKL
ncbi:predicted protein, partial [Nematostella vectensis]